MGSYGFSHGCHPEHPLKMGEDSKQYVVAMGVFLDKMAGRVMCTWLKDRCQHIDASG